MREVIVATGTGPLGQQITIGPHTLRADEAPEVGGNDGGPAAHELLLAALGACTSITVKMYADRKGWPLTSSSVRLTGHSEAERYVIDRTLHLEGGLSDEQRTRILEIADRCPVARTLKGAVEIRSTLS